VDWQGAAWTLHKGAPQVLAPRCQAGDPELTAALPDLARRGFRVLAVSGGPTGQEQAIGLIGLVDPISVAVRSSAAGVPVPVLP